MVQAANASGSPLDEAIDRLEAQTSLSDPEQFLDILDLAPQTSVPQAIRLWEIAVTQSTLADLQVANGDDSPTALGWQKCWSAGTLALRQTLATALTTENAEQTLTSYWEHGRAEKAAAYFVPLVRRLEGVLQSQRALIGFHWADDENSYRHKEADLSKQVSTPAVTEEHRNEAAIKLLAEVDRYQAIYVPKLQHAATVVDRVFTRCERFVQLFSPDAYPEIHRWRDLTKQLIDARMAALSHLMQSLEFDAYLPGEVVAGNVRLDPALGLVLNEEATTRVKQYAQDALQMFERSLRTETQITEERDQLILTILGDQAVTVEQTPTPTAEMSPGESRHPIEHKPWFRLAKVCWWAAAGVFLLVAVISAEDLFGLAGYLLLFGTALVGIKKAVYYVMLGRTTLHERAGSGFVDLDGFEQQISDRMGIKEDDGLRTGIEGLRRLYGSRVPAPVLQRLIDGELSNVRDKKSRALNEADREGKTINVESLRQQMAASTTWNSDEEREEFLLSCERLLVRLEVKYGSEIPVSAADAEADALDSGGVMVPPIR